MSPPLTDEDPTPHEPAGGASEGPATGPRPDEASPPAREDPPEADAAGSGDAALEEAELVGRAIGKMARNPKQRGFMSEMSEMMAFSGPMANPLHSKMTGEHITQTLELAHKHDEREYNLQDRRLEIQASSRYFRIAIFGMSLLAFMALVWLFRDKPDVLIPLLTGLGGLVSGFAAGWGYGRGGSDD